MRKPNRQSFIVLLAIFALVSFLVSKTNLSNQKKAKVKLSTIAPIQVNKEPNLNPFSVVKPVEVKPFKQYKTTESIEPKVEKEYSGPEWLKKVVSIYEKYYPSWQTGKSVTGSAQQINNTSAITNVTPPSTFSSTFSLPTSTYASTTSLAPGATRVVNTSTTPSSSKDTPAFSGGGDDLEVNKKNLKSEVKVDDKNEEDDPPALPTVTIVRSIDVSVVTLDITVKGEITGLIINEKLPSGYKITSATPNYSKVSNTSYQWLLFGRSVSEDKIIYQVSGSDGGGISGNYSSTRGSGSIIGQKNLP
ncbi:hypothetical protein M0P98_08820 [bacterium]|nr:hypothetical protein [bacterium]